VVSMELSCATPYVVGQFRLSWTIYWCVRSRLSPIDKVNATSPNQLDPYREFGSTSHV
jgi:hypothetical protein